VESNTSHCELGRLVRAACSPRPRLAIENGDAGGCSAGLPLRGLGLLRQEDYDAGSGRENPNAGSRRSFGGRVHQPSPSTSRQEDRCPLIRPFYSVVSEGRGESSLPRSGSQRHLVVLAGPCRWRLPASGRCPWMLTVIARPPSTSWPVAVQVPSGCVSCRETSGRRGGEAPRVGLLARLQAVESGRSRLESGRSSSCLAASRQEGLAASVAVRMGLARAVNASRGFGCCARVGRFAFGGELLQMSAQSGEKPARPPCPRRRGDFEGRSSYRGFRTLGSMHVG